MIPNTIITSYSYYELILVINGERTNVPIYRVSNSYMQLFHNSSYQPKLIKGRHTHLFISVYQRWRSVYDEVELMHLS